MCYEAIHTKVVLSKLNYQNGFFIEAGANDGSTQSNTLYLEKQLNWSGILIEPSLRHIESCKNLRKNSIIVHAALIDNENIKTIRGDFDGHLMSSVDGNRLSRKDNLIEVPARTLKNILIEYSCPKTIDLLSLDTEGHEFQILNGIDFSLVTFKYIVIEINVPWYDKIVELLTKNNYKLVENISQYVKGITPGWDGIHQDYLFEYIK